MQTIFFAPEERNVYSTYAASENVRYASACRDFTETNFIETRQAEAYRTISQANRLISFSIALILLGSLFASASAQTSSFTYQGRLADSGTPVNGNYDLQFALWNSSSGGGQIGSTQTVNSVAVSN